MRKALLLKYKLFNLSVNMAIFIAIFSFALLFGKLLECVIVLMSYFLLRYKFDKTFHHENMWVCFALSILMCWCMIAVTLPISISILSGIVVAMIDCYILYKVRDYFDIRNELREITKPKPLDKERLIELCKQHNYNELKTQMAIKFFIDKEKPREVWLWLCETQDNPIDWDSVKKTKYRMKKELFESKK